eukprot:gene4244-4543_t
MITRTHPAEKYAHVTSSAMRDRSQAFSRRNPLAWQSTVVTASTLPWPVSSNSPHPQQKDRLIAVNLFYLDSLLCVLWASMACPAADLEQDDVLAAAATKPQIRLPATEAVALQQTAVLDELREAG